MQIYLNSQVYPYFDTFTDVGIQNTTTRQTDTMLSDVDNDGDLDIIVSVTGTELFEIYINDGSGKFTYGSSENNGGGHAGRGMDAYDENNDGNIDIVIADEATGRIEIFSGDGLGNFIYRSTLSSGYTGPVDVKVGDLDNDSVVEYAVSSSNGLDIISKSIGVISSYAGQAYYIKILDYDNDSNSDIVWSDGAVNGINIVLGHGDTTFDSPVAYTVNNSPLGIAANDFDGDGDIDVAAVNHGDILSIFLTSMPSKAGIFVSPSPTLDVVSEN